MEGRYFACSDRVPSTMLDDDVQVVPNVHDLPDHGWSKCLHNRLQVGCNLPYIGISQVLRRLFSLNIVEFRDLKSNLLFLLFLWSATIIRDLDLLDVLFTLCNFSIVTKSQYISL